MCMYVSKLIGSGASQYFSINWHSSGCEKSVVYLLILCEFFSWLFSAQLSLSVKFDVWNHYFLCLLVRGRELIILT